ncbi:hypothetical protein DPV78_010752 [Talaromyces pinophilus]|jgi:hypothetical protein|nr:hypothetical protein DPV78_010752 [Talaromyces pinophilus]
MPGYNPPSLGLVNVDLDDCLFWRNVGLGKGEALHPASGSKMLGMFRNLQLDSIDEGAYRGET